MDSLELGYGLVQPKLTHIRPASNTAQTRIERVIGADQPAPFYFTGWSGLQPKQISIMLQCNYNS